MTEREELARLLWDCGALIITEEGELPLRWDGEALLHHEAAKTAVLDALEAMAREHYASAQAVLGGTWAELLAERLALPLNPAEKPERLLAVAEAVDDGAALHRQTAPLRASGASVAAAAIFHFGLESARKLLDKADVRLHWLTDLETAAAVALQAGTLDVEDYERLLSALL